MKPLNQQELDQRISDWVNDRQDGWTDKEAIQIRTLRKQAVLFIRYSSMSLKDAYYAFEQVKATYMDAHS